MTPLRRATFAALLFAPLGCGGDDPSATPRAMTIRVDTIPVFDVADTDPEAEPLFEWPGGGMRFANGNVIVADAWGSRVLLFDSSGSLIRSIGRPGGGPGEYASATWDGTCAPDTAFIVDPGQMRRDVIDADGNVVRTERVEPGSSFHACAPSGSTYRWEGGGFTRVPGPDDPPMSAQLHLGRLGSGEWRPVGTFETWIFGPLRRQTSVALTSGGFAVGTGASGAVQLHDEEGGAVRTIETGLEPRPVSDAMYEAALDRFVEYLPGRDDRLQMRDMMAQRFPPPDATPAYQAIFADPHDLIWVVASFGGEGHTRFEVFDQTGTHAGSVRLPVELTVFEIGAEHLLGRYLDDEGIPHVALYRIHRP